MELADKRPAVRLAMWIDTLIDSRSSANGWSTSGDAIHARASRIYLCELALRLERTGQGRDGIFDFPLTQEQLADSTGLTAVHTNRTLQSLRRDGLIQLSNGVLRVLDWEKLREVGDFDELYLHQKL